MADIHDFEPLWGSWQLRNPLGVGSFGTVYKAERNVLGETECCAVKHISLPQNQAELKMIEADLGISDRAIVMEYLIAQFRETAREYSVQRRFSDHPNFVHIYDFCYLEKKEDMPGFDLFIRMECLNGIGNRIHTATVDEKEVIRLGLDICTALEELHKEKLLHRDVKPQNIMVTDKGVYKLADFGTTRDMTSGRTQMSFKGTLYYMAPEVRIGTMADHRSDLYSLGIVLYELMNQGLMPFMKTDGSVSKDMAAGQRLSGMPLPAPSCASAAFSDIILKACALDPNKRYQSAAEMKAAIESLSREENQQKEKKPKAVLWIAVAATMLALGFGGGLLVPRQPVTYANGLLDQIEALTADVAERNVTIEMLTADNQELEAKLVELTVANTEEDALIQTLTDMSENAQVSGLTEVEGSNEASGESNYVDPPIVTVTKAPVDLAELDRKFAISQLVQFGTYPQNRSGKDQTPIEWIVLAREGNKALIISRYALDAQPYHTIYGDVTWETCSLRTWLNEDFLNTAFTADQQAAIVPVTVDNGPTQGNKNWSADGGRNIEDKVFLLSYAEAETYYPNDTARKCVSTDYTAAKGAYQSFTTSLNGRDCCWWYLRSPGETQHQAAYVYNTGELGRYQNVDTAKAAVRPALWINLESFDH